MSWKDAASWVEGNASRPSQIDPSWIYPSRIYLSRIYPSHIYPSWVDQGMSVGRMRKGTRPKTWGRSNPVEQVDQIVQTTI
jgi:hypothetical protein